MSDKLIQDRCEVCGKIVKSHMYDNEYGGGSYDRKTVAPYEERRIHVPELTYGFDVLVCQDCIDKEPSLHSLIFKHRKEWFKNKILINRKYIKQVRIDIQKLKESIPLIHKEIAELRVKQKELK
jgi:hypothetical protein